ncbi:MAG: efflux RND transporter periplasmic adaptor subunit, partial [Myxococcota bacterium]
GQTDRPGVPVQVSTARVQPVAPRAYVPGTVVSPDDAQLAAETSGKLTWVIEPGEFVKKGYAVARMDTARLKLTIASQTAEVKRLEAMVSLRDKDRQRQQVLADKNVGVAAELDRATADLAMSSQDLARAKAVLAQQQDELRRATLRAPFDGQVVERQLQAGEYAREGGAVVRVVNTGRVEIFARVPVRSAGYVKTGDEVPVRHGKRRTLATVLSIIQTGSVTNRSVTVRLALPKDGPAFMLGSAVSVGIPTDEVQKEVVVPRDAVVLRSGGAHVMVIADGKAKQVGVELGLGDGPWIAVHGDVAAGNTVVSIGAEGLSDGDVVEIVGSPT